MKPCYYALQKRLEAFLLSHLKLSARLAQAGLSAVLFLLASAVSGADLGMTIKKGGKKVGGEVTFGFLVLGVAPGSAAEQAGIDQGDFIVDWFFPNLETRGFTREQLGEYRDPTLQMGRLGRISYSEVPGTIAALSPQDCVRLAVVKGSATSEPSTAGNVALVEVNLSSSGPMDAGCKINRPSDPALKRREALAELLAMEDEIFPDSYFGLILRAIAVGKFELVSQVSAETSGTIVDASSELFGVNPNDPFVKFIRGAMELGSMVERPLGVLVAYVFARTEYVGSCGDPLTEWSQETVTTEETRDQFGNTKSSVPVDRSTAFAEAPSKFDALIRAENDITPSFLLAYEMAEYVSRLSCDSPARLQLEDNILAYFNRRSPVHVGPIPAQ